MPLFRARAPTESSPRVSVTMIGRQEAATPEASTPLVVSFKRLLQYALRRTHAGNAHGLQIAARNRR